MERMIKTNMPGFVAAAALGYRTTIRPSRYSSPLRTFKVAIAAGKVQPAIGPIFDKCYAICRLIGGSNQDCAQACAIIRDY